MSTPLLRLLTAARWARRTTVALTIAVLLALVVLLVWVRQRAPANDAAHLAMDPDEAIIVSREEWIAFQPRDADPTVGVVFYPGGKAEPAAYAPILRDLAGRGYLVVLIPMPLNLAFLGVDRADAVIARFPDIRRWFIAGHSLGGVAAAEYVDRHPGIAAGLILWASYPAATSDLSALDIPVLSIVASNDQLAAPEEIERAGQRLPPTTRYVSIAGGDHWGFADFTIPPAVGVIPRDDQKAQVLSATQAFLDAVDRGAPAASIP